MSEADNAFGRMLLAAIHKSVKRHFPKINLREDAWVWHFYRDHWEFHGPDRFYWNGSAGNAYDARYKGWSAWLKSKGIDLNIEAA